MDEPGKSPRVAVTDAWRTEQQAKREAYEAKRRAWMQRFERGAEGDSGAGEDAAVPMPGGPGADGGSAGPAHGAVRDRRRRQGGPVHDPRQARFVF